MWGINYSVVSIVSFCGFGDYFIVFLHLIISFLYEMGDSSPFYSSFSPLILGPLLIPKDASFIYLSPIQLMCINSLLEIVLETRGTLNRTDTASALMKPTV